MELVEVVQNFPMMLVDGLIDGWLTVSGALLITYLIVPWNR